MTMSEPSADGQGSSSLRSVLNRIRDGDEDAARELLTKYESQVRMVVRRQLPRLLRSRFDSLDFLQSVWGSFFQRIRAGTAEFEDPRHLIVFLAKTARNKVIDKHRRAASRKADVRREEPLCLEGTRPRDVIAKDDTASQVAEAREMFGRLRELLPEGRRAILELRAEGHTTPIIAERLGISERTVRRVLELLQRQAIDEGEVPG